MEGKKTVMVSNILIWNKEIGFIRINEGSGDNLSHEDEQQGYVDYIMLEFMQYDGMEINETDGAQIMLKELYQEKFKDYNEADVVQYLIDTEWIPDADYYYLYAK